jgi:hypothetical protein
MVKAQRETGFGQDVQSDVAQVTEGQPVHVPWQARDLVATGGRSREGAVAYV